MKETFEFILKNIHNYHTNIIVYLEASELTHLGSEASTYENNYNYYTAPSLYHILQRYTKGLIYLILSSVLLDITAHYIRAMGMSLFLDDVHLSELINHVCTTDGTNL